VACEADRKKIGAFELFQRYYVGRSSRIPPLEIPVPVPEKRSPEVVSRSRIALLEKYLKRHRPEVLVAHNASFKHWLASLGYRIPDDIGLYAMNGEGTPDEIENRERTGKAAFHLMLTLLKTNQFGIPKERLITVVDNVWERRSSIRNAEAPHREVTSPA